MPDMIVLDFQSRIELATLPPFNVLTLRWHHDTRALNAYKVRVGGGSHSTGQYIPNVHGSKNTESLGVLLHAGSVVETQILIDDLILNDDEEDGLRTLYIYGRDAATSEWIELGGGAASLSIYLWRRPPEIEVSDLVLHESEIASSLILSANREFKVARQDGAIPSRGWSQAVEIEFPGLGVLGHFLSTDSVFPPHVDGAGLVATQIIFANDDVGSLNVLSDREEGVVRCLVEDAFGQKELRVLPFELKVASAFSQELDNRYRDAVPPGVKDQDPVLMGKYLPVWDALAGQFDGIVDGMADLIDPETAPVEALPWLFKEAGLLFPNVPGYPEANLRRLLSKANEIHSSRFTENGLKFYLGLLIPNASVTLSGLRRGSFVFANSSVLGLPTAAMIDSAGSVNDQNNYLFGPVVDQAITITIQGVVSDEMKEFINATIRRELLYADDAENPKPVNVVFA